MRKTLSHSLIFLVTCLLLVPSYSSGQNSGKKKKVKKISLLDQLQMESISNLELTINKKRVFDDWKYQSYHWGFGRLGTTDKEEFADEIKVRTRGKYRSQKCSNPPLKIKLFKDDLKDRNFKKLNEFKIVYPCHEGQEYQDYVYKEYLVYKMYNVLTENSLRVQLINFSLKDSLELLETKNYQGFLIEHREEFIKRIDAKMSDVMCMQPVHLDQEAYTLFQVFQFMIGNTDWLLPTCQNAEVVSRKDGKMVPIPFDFDFSGMVSTVYATPCSFCNLTSVKQRYFLGHEKTLAELEPVFQHFQDRKQELINTIEEFDYLGAPKRKQMVKFLESFYKILDNPKKVKKAFLKSMPDIMATQY